MKKFIPFFALLIMALVFSACDKPKTEGDRKGGGTETQSGGNAGKSGGAHDEAPHDGLFAIMGDHEFHVETVADEAAGTVTAYIYGSGHDYPVAKVDVAEVTYNLMVDGAPKTFTLPRTAEYTETEPATYSLKDAELAGLISDGWDGGGELKIIVDGNSKIGKISKKPGSGH